MSRTVDLAEAETHSNGAEAFDRPERPAAVERDPAEEVGAPSPSISEAPPREGEKPWYKKPLWWVIGVIAAIVVAVVVVVWWLYARQYESTDDAFIDAHVVHVAPQVAGRVQKVLVQDNQDVKAGQLLVQIDPSDYQVELDQAQAALAQAQGMVEEAKAKQAVAEANAAQAHAQVTVAQANARNAQQELRRYQQLSSAAVSQQQLDNATAAATSSGAQVQAAVTASRTAQAAVGSAKAKVEKARLMLSYTKIEAPEDGQVTRKSVVAGNYIQVGQQLMAIVPHAVWVTANYKETQLEHMRPGQPVTISVDAYPELDLHGQVDSIQAGSGAVFSLLPPENATGNYVKVVQRVPVKITIENPPQAPRLAPGMSVEPTVKVR